MCCGSTLSNPSKNYARRGVELALPVDNNEVYLVALSRLATYSLSALGRCHQDLAKFGLGA